MKIALIFLSEINGLQKSNPTVPSLGQMPELVFQADVACQEAP